MPRLLPLRPSRLSAAALAAVLLLAACGDDDEDGATSTSTSTSTTERATSSTSTTIPSEAFDAEVVVFPDATSESSYADPAELVRAFAVELAGFVDPVVGDLRPGEGADASVTVRPTVDGPATVVQVRRRAPRSRRPSRFEV